MLTYIKAKYWKPSSIAWGGSVMSIAAGVFIAFEPVHQMTEFATAVQTLYGGASPMVLVNAGIVGVGLRGAMS